MDELLNYLWDDEDKIFKLLSDLKYKKYGTLNNITVSVSKLEKLEISLARIDKLKTQFYYKNSILMVKV